MKIEWQKCPCGSPACRYWQPVGLGSFHQGTGFDEAERDLISAAFEALSEAAPPTPDLRSDVDNLDEVVHELGIEDSETTPAEAVRELKAEIERRDETIRRLREALLPFARLCNEIESLANKVGGGPGDWSKACHWEDLVKAKAALSAIEKEEGDE